MLGLGAITLIVLGWAAFTYLASRRLAEQAKAVESQVMGRVTELSAANQQLPKEIIEAQVF